MSTIYRQYFTPEEIALLDATPRDDLTSEINLLRVLLARVFESWQQARDLAIKQQAAILSALSHGAVTIAQCLRLQCRLHNPLDALWQAIEQGERIARKRHHVDDYLSPQPVS